MASKEISLFFFSVDGINVVNASHRCGMGFSRGVGMPLVFGISGDLKIVTVVFIIC